MILIINTIFLVQGFDVNASVLNRRIGENLGFDVKIKIVSQGIAQLIDLLSEQYHMRFTIVWIGTNPQMNELACEIVSATKSLVNLKNVIIIDKRKVIDYDDSYIVLHKNVDNHALFHTHFGTTKLLAYRRKITLIFNVEYDDNDMIRDIVDQTQGWPHDVYLIAHSPENGSMWLMGNELFFHSSKMKWKTPKFMNEYRKFHNCTIEVGEENNWSNIYWKIHENEQRAKLLKFIFKHNITFPSYNESLHDSDIRFKEYIDHKKGKKEFGIEKILAYQ